MYQIIGNAFNFANKNYFKGYNSSKTMLKVPTFFDFKFPISEIKDDFLTRVAVFLMQFYWDYDKISSLLTENDGTKWSMYADLKYSMHFQHSVETDLLLRFWLRYFWEISGHNKSGFTISPSIWLIWFEDSLTSTQCELWNTETFYSQNFKPLIDFTCYYQKGLETLLWEGNLIKWLPAECCSF